MTKPSLRVVKGQPSWTVRSETVAMSVARLGGFMAPVTFHRESNKPIQPFAIAPWATEKLPPGVEPIIQGLRGDFFCMPFSGGDTRYRGKTYPSHGETANRNWRLLGQSRTKTGVSLHLEMGLRIQAGTVTKSLTLLDGHNAVYSRHRLSGMSGPMTFAHHPCIQYPDRPGSGRLSFSRHVHASTFYEPVESPEVGTYSILKPNQTIDNLKRVPLIDGTTTDVTSYPARRGYEDLVMICADPSLPFAWSAVTFAREGYVYFNIKNPRVLASTMLWITNGGRHYAPWNGRHINVMGMEECTTFWGDGIAASAQANVFTRRGIQTVTRLDARRPYDVTLIMGVAKVPRGFDRVRNIRRSGEGRVTLVGENRKRVEVPLDLDFLERGEMEGLSV